jgi:NodT family efflux transporter outer membrane factor (OMF) lipoprotein
MSGSSTQALGAGRDARRRGAVALGALALALAGCSIGPDFITPKAKVEANFREARDGVINSKRETYQRWWTGFRDPTLNRLVETAYQQNLTLLEAGTRVLQARAQLGVAVGDLYPQSQQASGNTTYMQPSGTDAVSNPNGGQSQFWRADFSGQLNWELDFWGKFRHGVESADAAYLASIASYDDVLVTLLGDVATTYIGIRTLESQIRIAQENVVKQKDALQIARARFEGGATSELDVFQAQNVLAQTQAAVPQLTAQLLAGQAALAVLLGETPARIASELRPSHGIPVAAANVAVGIPADLLRRRPDVRAAELKALAQSAQVGMAEADLYPAFALGGAFGTLVSATNGHSLSQLFTSPSLTFAFSPSFSWPILNYGQITNNVRVEDAKLQGLLIDYQNTVLAAQRDVETGLAGYVEGRKQAAYLKISVEAANNALKVALTEYQLGSRDFTTVLTAEQNLYQAQTSYAASVGNVAVNLTKTYRALGGGWQIRDGREFVDDATRDQMRNRTNWGDVLPPAGQPKPEPPGLPGPSDIGPTVRPPQW